MTAVQTLVAQIRQKLSNQLFLRNLSWLGSSEMILRVLRLGSTVILARFLTAEDYGLVAIVMTVCEFARVFMDVGITAKLIQTDQKNLDDLCNSAYWLGWVIFVGAFLVQCLAAFPISWFYHDDQLVWPIFVTALPYLTRPFSSVQWALITRENRLKVTAIANIIEYGSGYVLAAIFAILGMGMWAVVLSWVLVAPVGGIAYYMNHSWRPNSGFTTRGWGEIFGFGKNFLGVQLLKALRNNLDYLIVGHFLNVSTLGVYFFAFNAGLGISLSVVNALNSALFPHLCAARGDRAELKKRFFGGLKTISLIIIPLVILQSSLAPFYVPIVFGQKWVAAVPVLILICLSAIPRPFADAGSQLLMAVGKPELDLRWNIMFTVLFTVALLIGVQWQAVGVAASVLILHLTGLPLFTIWTTRYVFKRA